MTRLLTLLLIFAIGLLPMACSSSNTSDKIPEDINRQRDMLKEKKHELRELTKLIERLDSSIAAKDPNFSAPTGRAVTIDTVRKTDFSHYISLQGSVQADDLVDATAEIGGRILQLSVDEGESVRRGQLIATIDMESLTKQKEEVEISLDLAKTTYERQKRLWDQNIGSEIQYLQAKNQVERLEKSLESMNIQLGKNKVYAPASGVVERVILQSGELASPGMPIVQILNTSDLKVVADIPETYLPIIDRGEKVRIEFSAIGEEVVEPVSMISRTINPENRTFQIEAKLRGNNKLLKPNLLATVYINDFNADDVITLPIELVQKENNGRSYVYRLAEDQDGFFAEKVYVKTGKDDDGMIIIDSGLTAGDLVINEGSRLVSAGERLNILSTKQSTADNG